MKRIKRPNGTGTIQKERNKTFTTKITKVINGERKE